MIKKDKLVHVYSDENKFVVNTITGATYIDIFVNEEEAANYAETDMIIISEKERNLKLAAKLKKQEETENKILLMEDSKSDY